MIKLFLFVLTNSINRIGDIKLFFLFWGIYPSTEKILTIHANALYDKRAGLEKNFACLFACGSFIKEPFAFVTIPMLVVFVATSC